MTVDEMEAYCQGVIKKMNKAYRRHRYLVMVWAIRQCRVEPEIARLN